MINWVSENWQGLLGGGSLTTIITFLANRKHVKADFLSKVEGIYGSLVDDLKSERVDLKEEIKGFKDDFKQLRDGYISLQDQFNGIQLAYAKEVEKSQNWEKLHRELSEKYTDLIKDHDSLKKDHDQLKKEFETYKKK